MDDEPTPADDDEPTADTDADSGDGTDAPETAADDAPPEPTGLTEALDIHRQAGERFDLDTAAAREIAQTVARLGANEAPIKGADLSRLVSSIANDAMKDIAIHANITNLIASVVKANNMQMDELARTFANSALFTTRAIQDSLSVASLYSARQLVSAVGSQKPSTAPRASRMPEHFFDTHAVEIDSLKSLLKALSTLQMKHHEHRLVWRGQQNASWAVHSSLYRRLEESGAVDEDRLVGAEVEALNAASLWGRGVPRPLEFFADLQHNGAPTRLIDVSTDPEIACWFAVEAHPKQDAKDGLVLAWGRAPRVGRRVPEPAADVSADLGDVPFWHSWAEHDLRRRADWGTGTRTWTWFPPALSDRMRAQRAGFLLEAGPILTSAVIDVFNDALPMNWRGSEIARATSIVGLPSRHDVLTKPNAAHLVPVFALRILAKAKKPIRDYLEGKGLRHSSVYPDLGGLVQHLRGPYGPK